MTALQVREHADLTTDELRRALHEAAPRGLAARRALPAAVRAAPYDSELPGEGVWTVGYLFDVIHLRDPWLHRVDICRATGRDLLLTPTTTAASSPTSWPTGPRDTAGRSSWS
jgi:hypothetical protein